MNLPRRHFIQVFCLDVSHCNINFITTVLVAHNGFTYDFRIMVAEVERRNKLQLFCGANLMFADTLSDLVQVDNNMLIFCDCQFNVLYLQMRVAKDPFFDDWSAQDKLRLGMGHLFARCFPGQTFTGKYSLNFILINVFL